MKMHTVRKIVEFELPEDNVKVKLFKETHDLSEWTEETTDTGVVFKQRPLCIYESDERFRH